MRNRRTALLRASIWIALGTTCALADSARAGDVYITRDARGRPMLTNTRAVVGMRKLKGGNFSVAEASRPVVVPRASFAAAPAIASAKRARFVEHVTRAAQRYTLSPRLIEAVIAVESDFQSNAVSRKGAQGLMQLMPDTARDLAVADPFDPAANIDGGARYLRALLDQFNQNVTLALAAYNAGPTTVRNSGGIPRIPETVDYVRKVKSLLGHGGTGSAGTGSITARRDSAGRLVVSNTGAGGSLSRPGSR